MNPMFRLSRPIIGDRLHAPREIVVQAKKRQVVHDAAVQLRDYVRPEKGVVRKPKSQPQVAPNAPQLIRLVRTPFSLDRSSFKRRPLSRITRGEPKRTPYRVDFESAWKASRPPESYPRPTDSRFRCAPRVRPSIDAWLGQMETGND